MVSDMPIPVDFHFGLTVSLFQATATLPVDVIAKRDDRQDGDRERKKARRYLGNESPVKVTYGKIGETRYRTGNPFRESNGGVAHNCSLVGRRLRTNRGEGFQLGQVGGGELRLEIGGRNGSAGSRGGYAIGKRRPD